ncbi:MAG: glycosyltransferase [Saprospiraceae bacterium]
MHSILHVTPYYLPEDEYGGPVVTVSRLAEEQVRAGAQVCVFTTTTNKPNAGFEPTGVQVFRFRRWGEYGFFSPGLLWAFWHMAPKITAVHLHTWWNFTAFGIALLGKVRGVRMVVCPHGMLSPYSLSKSRMRIFFQKKVGQWLLGGAMLHATSRQEAEELVAVHPRIPIQVVPNIVYLPAELRPIAEKAPADAFDLLFLSRVHPKKGLDLLLMALARMPDECAWRLTVGGSSSDNYPEKMKKLAQNLGIAHRVYWHGWVDGDAKWPLLAESDLLVLPSHNENFAIVVLEALAEGTPVVLSNQVGLHDYVRENDFGWCCEPTAESLRETVRAAFADTAKRWRIRQVAPNAVRADFDPHTTVQAYFGLYNPGATSR